MKKLLHWINILGNTYCSTTVPATHGVPRIFLYFQVRLDWWPVKYCLTAEILSLVVTGYVGVFYTNTLSVTNRPVPTHWNHANIYQPRLTLTLNWTGKLWRKYYQADIRWLCHHVSYFHGQSGIIPLTGDIWGLEGEGGSLTWKNVNLQVINLK